MRLASGLGLLLSFFASIAVLQATTFIPLPLEDQLDASDSVVLATNQGKAYKRLPNGDIVTEYSFKLELASGLPEHKVLSPNSFKVMTPGGLWLGRYYQVDGAAVFKEGEQSLLFLKQTPYGWIVNNLSMGKFSVSHSAEGTWFKNSVFPTHPKIGTVSMGKLNELLQKKFNSPLAAVDIDKYVHNSAVEKNEKAQSRGNRAPASIEESQESESMPVGLIWMMLLFGVLGFVYRVRAKKTR